VTGAHIAADPGLSGTYATRLTTRRREWAGRVKDPVTVDVVMASPPTVSALATTTAIAGGVAYPSNTSPSTVGAQDRGTFNYRGGNITAAGTTYPNNLYVRNTAQTDPANGNTAPFAVDFWFDGTTLEILGKGNNSVTRLRVDGQIVSAAGTTWTNDGNNYILPVTFGARAMRRITVEASVNFIFGGVNAGPNDTVTAARLDGPKTIVIGDSFTDGAGATLGAVSCWARKFSEAMNWPNLWCHGLGGTGYLNPGTRSPSRSRIVTDCLNYSPDVVIFEGGINDISYGGFTAAGLQSEALTLFQQVATALPNTLQIVLSPMWRNGVESFLVNLIPARDALKEAAVQVPQCVFIDLLEMPLDATITTTISNSATGGATTFQTASVPLPRRSTVEIGTGAANPERRVITNVSGTGPYTHTVAALTSAHTAGETVKTVGPALWTGTGKVGATTGAGNSDLLVSSDGTHPTQVGHDEIGLVTARLVAQALSA